MGQGISSKGGHTNKLLTSFHKAFSQDGRIQHPHFGDLIRLNEKNGGHQFLMIQRLMMHSISESHRMKLKKRAALRHENLLVIHVVLTFTDQDTQDIELVSIFDQLPPNSLLDCINQAIRTKATFDERFIWEIIDQVCRCFQFLLDNNQSIPSVSVNDIYFEGSLRAPQILVVDIHSLLTDMGRPTSPPLQCLISIILKCMLLQQYDEGMVLIDPNYNKEIMDTIPNSHSYSILLTETVKNAIRIVSTHDNETTAFQIISTLFTQCKNELSRGALLQHINPMGENLATHGDHGANYEERRDTHASYKRTETNPLTMDSSFQESSIMGDSNRSGRFMETYQQSNTKSQCEHASPLTEIDLADHPINLFAKKGPRASPKNDEISLITSPETKITGFVQPLSGIILQDTFENISKNDEKPQHQNTIGPVRRPQHRRNKSEFTTTAVVNSQCQITNDSPTTPCRGEQESFDNIPKSFLDSENNGKPLKYKNPLPHSPGKLALLSCPQLAFPQARGSITSKSTMGNYLKYLENLLISNLVNGNYKTLTMENQDGVKSTPSYVEHYQDGSIYEGEMSSTLRHGRGKFVFSDGTAYEGEFLNGMFSGYGVLRTSNSSIIYEGQWLNNTFNGYGTFHNLEPKDNEEFDYTDFRTLQDAWLKYTGEFRAFRKHGKGTLCLANGDIFYGYFEDDNVQGLGSYHKVNGTTILSGEWSNNELTRIF